MRVLSSRVPHLPHFDGARRRPLVIALVAVALAALFFAGYWPRHSAREKLAAESSAKQRSPPPVKVVTAMAANGGRPLTLPGSLVASREALVNARATGYVTRWNVDIGDRVREGDPLAELDTPELDQQLQQARGLLKQKKAALEQAVANLEYAQVTAARQDALLPGVTTRQAVDQAHAQVKVWEANVDAAHADIAAAEANVRELVQLVSFGHVVAPFDGRITQRNIDVGSLVTAGGAPGASSAQAPLFRIEAIDPIRVFVQVPQAFALSVKDAQAATVTVRQIPGRTFEGRVTRTAGTLDPTARTLNTEIDIPNPAGELLGGMFADVTIAVSVAHRVVRVPSSAVITDASGVHVATVGAAGEVHLAPVVRGLDNGSEIDVVDGLTGGERIIVNPGGDVTEGMHVEPVTGP